MPEYQSAKGRPMSAEKGYQKYFEGIGSILARVRETQGKNIEQAAKIISDAVSQDGLIHAFGAGHSNMLAEEMFFRAGMLAPVNHVVDVSIAGTVAATKSAYTERLEGIGPILYNHVRPSPQDIFLIISNSGRNAAPIELAREAKEHGHGVVAVTSVTYSKSQPSRHSSGKLLLDYADVVLDNCGLVGDVCVTIPDMKQGIGPTSTVAGAYLLNAVMVQAVFNLKEAGVGPPVFLSGNFDGGMAFNQALLDRYWDRIRYW
jgi:uncharacterized phosphosugar-binding protein